MRQHGLAARCGVLQRRLSWSKPSFVGKTFNKAEAWGGGARIRTYDLRVTSSNLISAKKAPSGAFLSSGGWIRTSDLPGYELQSYFVHSGSPGYPFRGSLVIFGSQEPDVIEWPDQCAIVYLDYIGFAQINKCERRCRYWLKPLCGRYWKECVFSLDSAAAVEVRSRRKVI